LNAVMEEGRTENQKDSGHNAWGGAARTKSPGGALKNPRGRSIDKLALWGLRDGKGKEKSGGGERGLP